MAGTGFNLSTSNQGGDILAEGLLPGDLVFMAQKVTRYATRHDRGEPIVAVSLAQLRLFLEKGQRPGPASLDDFLSLDGHNRLVINEYNSEQQLWEPHTLTAASSGDFLHAFNRVFKLVGVHQRDLNAGQYVVGNAVPVRWGWNATQFGAQLSIALVPGYNTEARAMRVSVLHHAHIVLAPSLRSLLTYNKDARKVAGLVANDEASDHYNNIVSVAEIKVGILNHPIGSARLPSTSAIPLAPWAPSTTLARIALPPRFRFTCVSVAANVRATTITPAQRMLKSLAKPRPTLYASRPTAASDAMDVDSRPTFSPRFSNSFAAAQSAYKSLSSQGPDSSNSSNGAAGAPDLWTTATGRALIKWINDTANAMFPAHSGRPSDKLNLVGGLKKQALKMMQDGNLAWSIEDYKQALASTMDRPTNNTSSSVRSTQKTGPPPPPPTPNDIVDETARMAIESSDNRDTGRLTSLHSYLCAYLYAAKDYLEPAELLEMAKKVVREIQAKAYADMNAWQNHEEYQRNREYVNAVAHFMEKGIEVQFRRNTPVQKWLKGAVNKAAEKHGGDDDPFLTVVRMKNAYDEALVPAKEHVNKQRKAMDAKQPKEYQHAKATRENAQDPADSAWLDELQPHIPADKDYLPAAVEATRGPVQPSASAASRPGVPQPTTTPPLNLLDDFGPPQSTGAPRPAAAAPAGDLIEFDRPQSTTEFQPAIGAFDDFNEFTPLQPTTGPTAAAPATEQIPADPDYADNYANDVFAAGTPALRALSPPATTGGATDEPIEQGQGTIDGRIAVREAVESANGAEAMQETPIDLDMFAATFNAPKAALNFVRTASNIDQTTHDLALAVQEKKMSEEEATTAFFTHVGATYTAVTAQPVEDWREFFAVAPDGRDRNRPPPSMGVAGAVLVTLASTVTRGADKDNARLSQIEWAQAYEQGAAQNWPKAGVTNYTAKLMPSRVSENINTDTRLSVVRGFTETGENRVAIYKDLPGVFDAMATFYETVRAWGSSKNDPLAYDDPTFSNAMAERLAYLSYVACAVDLQRSYGRDDTETDQLLRLFALYAIAKFFGLFRTYVFVATQTRDAFEQLQIEMLRHPSYCALVSATSNISTLLKTTDVRFDLLNRFRVAVVNRFGEPPAQV